MRVRRLAAGFAVVVLAGTSSALGAGETKPQAPGAAGAALAWLKQRQFASGALPGFGGTSEGVYAIVAGGGDPASGAWKSGEGNTPIQYLEQEADSYDCEQGSDCNAGRAAKIVLAAVMAGRDPRRFGGNDLIAGMMADTKSTGIIPSNFAQAFAMIALPAAGEQAPPAVIARALAAQKQDGGWGFAPGGGSDTNSTGLMIQGLVAVRPAAGFQQQMIDAALPRAADYLASQQRDDGGFAFVSAYDSEPVSTAAVIMAVRALNDDPKTGRWVRPTAGGLRGPLDFLLGFQSQDGSFPFGDAAGSTVAAVPGVVERSLVCLVGLARCPGAPEAPPAEPGPDSDPPLQHTPGDAGRPPQSGDPPVVAPAAPAAQLQPPAGAPSGAGAPTPPPVVQQASSAASGSEVPTAPDAAVPPAAADAVRATFGMFPPGGGGFASPELMAASAFPPSPAPATPPDVQAPQLAAQPAYFAVAVVAAALLIAVCFGFSVGAAGPRCAPGPAVGCR